VQTASSHLRERLSSLELPGTVWIGSKPVEAVRRLGTGIPQLDVLLAGGFPRGHLSEVVGASSSGRTALTCALLAAATRAGEIAAVIDTPDVLHPASLQFAGADLNRVLWVRPPTTRAGLECAELILSGGGFGLLVIDLDTSTTLRLPSSVWVRLTRVARQAGTVLMLLSSRRLAGSFAALSLTLTPRRFLWSSTPWRLFQGVTTQAVVTRNRLDVAGKSVGLRMKMAI